MIAKLYAAMPMQGREATDLKAMTAVYVEDLAEYPIDILQSVFTRWRRMEKWFPRIAELREQCEWIGKNRMIRKRAILDALRNPD